jgi:hypothetical protein
MSQQDLPGVDLNYAPRPRTSRKRRVRLAAVLLLCAGAVAAWWWRGDIKAAAATAKLLQAQRRCMTFDAPTGLVAYEEDAARAQALLGQPHYLPSTLQDGTTTAALWWPTPVQEFPDADRFFVGAPNKALLFLHERTTPGGRRVLVTAMAWPKPGVLGDVSLGFRAVLPASWNTPPQTAGGLWAAQPELGRFHGERRLRILAGRPDPNDPSRFTIEYETRRCRGAWDVSVRDNPTASPGDNPVVLELAGRADNPVE